MQAPLLDLPLKGRNDESATNSSDPAGEPCVSTRKALEPYRSNVVVGCECIFCWYWLADLCAAEEIAFVLGHALYMKAIHGGKAKNDKIDSHKAATLLRGGAFPMAFVYPPEMRTTRDLLRRRLFFARKRGELFGHIRSTFQQYNVAMPSTGQLRYQKHRAGLVETFDDPALRATIEADLGPVDPRRRLGRSVYFMLKNQEAFRYGSLLRLIGRRDGEPEPSNSSRSAQVSPVADSLDWTSSLAPTPHLDSAPHPSPELTGPSPDDRIGTGACTSCPESDGTRVQMIF